MITCVLAGGLGNNLFMAANAINIAKELNVDFIIPETARRKGARTFKQSDKLELNEIFDIPFKLKDIDVSSFKKYIHYDARLKRGFLYEPPLKQDNTCYHGYFQSEKYFSSINVNDYFILKKDKINELKKKYALDDSVLGIQYRLAGDRVQKHMQFYHKDVSKNYYLQAYEILKLQRIFLFSDNLKKANQILSEDLKNIEPIDEDCVNSFLLMSQCKNLIIGNSTFAWWAAYLGVDKKIICPHNEWFGPGYAHFDKADLFPNNWIKL